MSIKKWLPNVVTLLLAALLVITQHVWADPIAERLTSTATGSSKTTINYQGYLTDSSGNPVNDPLDMVFRLYNVESGGEALWTETQNVEVQDGLFSVLLGNVTPISTEIIASNNDLWLGIAVGGDEEMSPREKIASAPYAMLANVPDGSITQAKLADNAVTSAKIQDEQVSNSDVGFNYAGSSAKGGPASNVDCSNCISSGEIQNGQVGNADLADNAVNSAKIQDGQVGTADLANNAVTSAKIQDGQVTDAKLAFPFVTRSVNLCFTPYFVCDGVVSDFNRTTLGSNQIWSGSFSFTPFDRGLVSVIGFISLADDGTTFGAVPVAVWLESNDTARFSAIVPDRYFNTVNSRLIVALVGR